jgi:apolipoprotein D and lipocalin family protein
MRKGLGQGKGMGYYNLTGRDPMVHSLSARGIKQPQTIALWNRSQRSLPNFNPISNPETKTTLQIGQVFDVEKHPKYKVYASEKSFVIGGGKADFTNWSDATLVQQWRAEPHGTPRYYELLMELGRRRDKKSGLEKLSQHQKVFGGKIDFNKYQGEWYQQGGTPTWFQSGCKDSKAEYTNKGDYIEVKNSCLKDGKESVTIGKAYKKGSDRLEVDFVGGGLFTGDYNVVYLDKNYQNAIVIGGKNIWILSRNKNISERQYNQLIQIAKRKGYDTSKIKRGGKVPFSKKGIDVFSLPVENAIYVPSTDKDQQKIPDQKFAERITETEKFLSDLYGGFTRYEEVGGFKDFDTKKIIKENGARVVSFSSKSDAKDQKKAAELKRWIVRKQKQWGQQSIGYEREGDLFYINKRK